MTDVVIMLDRSQPNPGTKLSTSATPASVSLMPL
jgi:hypothetical protein